MSDQRTADPAATTEDPIRVVVADDHVLYRRGLQLVIGHADGIEIVGEASDGAEATLRAVELIPDVVLMDVRMPRTSGIEACRAIRQQVPSAKIIMLTMSDEENDLFEAVKAGASGYLLKDVPGEEVAASIVSVHQGHSLISPAMASKLMAEFAQLSTKQDSVPAPITAAPRLTERELEVLGLVARGLANKMIARKLFISENTVKNHVRNILEKLQLHSRMEAAMYAVRENLLHADE